MKEEIIVQGAKHDEQEYHGDFPVSPEVVKSMMVKGAMMRPDDYTVTGTLHTIKIDAHPHCITIGVKRMNPAAEMPKYNKQGDSGFDFVAMEDAIIAPGQTALIPIGLAFELPLGTEIQIRPRSGLSAKTKARVTLGTDDANYRGELKVNIDNITQQTWTFDKVNQEVLVQTSDEVRTLENKMISIYDLDVNTNGLTVEDGHVQEVPAGSIVVLKGQRIAQGVIAFVYKGMFIEKDELSETERGTTGFGNTGV